MAHGQVCSAFYLVYRDCHRKYGQEEGTLTHTDRGATCREEPELTPIQVLPTPAEPEQCVHDLSLA